MGMRKALLENVGSMDVIITMGQNDPSHIEIPFDRSNQIVRRGQQVIIPLDKTGGCAKMYIWSLAKRLLWCGIVPLSTDAEIPLIVDIDTKKVTYGALDIPECVETRHPVLREHFGATLQSPPSGSGPDFLKISIAIAVILAAIVIGKWAWGSKRRYSR